MQNHIDQLTRELYEEKEQLSDLKQEHEISQEQVKTLKEEREALQKNVYSLEDALTEEKEKAKREKEQHIGKFSFILVHYFRVFAFLLLNIAPLPRHSSQTALDEEATIVFTAQIEERDKIIGDLKKRIEELAKQAGEARTLRDELDILREKALLSTGLEDKLKKAQQKSEQVADLKKQIKTLEEQNDQYLKKALDAGKHFLFPSQFISSLFLEDTASKANSMKSHLESYKSQLLQLKSEHTQLEVTMRTQQSDFERMKTDYNTANLENQALKFRVDKLQNEVDDLTLNASHGTRRVVQ